MSATSTKFIFERQAVAAAQAACAGDAPQTRAHLQQCFDLLSESRQRFYPVDAYLLDCTLVAETTLGGKLRTELAGALPINLLMSAKLLERMETSEPASLLALREALSAGNASLAGGEYEERELPLCTLDEINRHLALGQTMYERQLGRGAKIYARRRFGLSPGLPQILARRGFAGALHFTLDDGHFPRRWAKAKRAGRDSI